MYILKENIFCSQVDNVYLQVVLGVTILKSHRYIPTYTSVKIYGMLQNAVKNLFTCIPVVFKLSTSASLLARDN